MLRFKAIKFILTSFITVLFWLVVHIPKKLKSKKAKFLLLKKLLNLKKIKFG